VNRASIMAIKTKMESFLYIFLPPDLISPRANGIWQAVELENREQLFSSYNQYSPSTSTGWGVFI